MENKKKPIAVKPRLYAMYFKSLMEIARDMGYNLLISGSINRDLDLIAVPWMDDPKSEIELIQAFDIYLSGNCMDKAEYYMHKILAGGRSAYVINLNRLRDSEGIDLEYYLDISITPNLKDAIRKQTPMQAFQGEYDDEFICPACNYQEDGITITNLKFCPDCGQKLKWD